MQVRYDAVIFIVRIAETKNDQQSQIPILTPICTSYTRSKYQYQDHIQVHDDIEHRVEYSTLTDYLCNIVYFIALGSKYDDRYSLLCKNSKQIDASRSDHHPLAAEVILYNISLVLPLYRYPSYTVQHAARSTYIVYVQQTEDSDTSVALIPSKGD